MSKAKDVNIINPFAHLGITCTTFCGCMITGIDCVSDKSNGCVLSVADSLMISSLDWFIDKSVSFDGMVSDKSTLPNGFGWWFSSYNYFLSGLCFKYTTLNLPCQVITKL